MEDKMNKSVCIVGMGVCESDEPMNELAHKEMLFYATRQALDDAGIERKDIDSGFTASMDFLEGRSLSNQFTVDSIGGVMKACDQRVSEEGIYALFSGCMEVMADPSKIVVVAMVQKPSDRDAEDLGFQKIIADTMEPVFSRPVCKSVPHMGSLEAVLAAMEVRSYMALTGLDIEEIGKVVAKNLRNAGKPAKLKDILQSEQMAGPVLKSMRAPAKDAACTFLLASEEKAKRMKSEPVFVRGMGWCSGNSHFSTRSHGRAHETKYAARQAYKMAGILRPEQDMDLAEVNDWYAHRELMHCEALGLCGSKDIRSCINEGVFEKEGQMPVNPSGGLLGSGNPIGGAGLLSVARIVKQLRGEAGFQQVPGARFGLAHGWSGLPIAAAGVALLSSC